MIIKLLEALYFISLIAIVAATLLGIVLTIQHNWHGATIVWFIVSSGFWIRFLIDIIKNWSDREQINVKTIYNKPESGLTELHFLFIALLFIALTGIFFAFSR